MDRIFRVGTKTLDVVERVVMIAALVALGGIVLTVFWQVVARYLISQSTAWAPELAQTAFVWTALLAIPLGVRRGRHMLVDIWRGRSVRVQKIVSALASAVVIGICATLVLYSLEMLATSFQRDLPSLGISSGWQMLAVPVGFGLCIPFQLEVLLRQLVTSAASPADRLEQTL
ncbi:TRAP transporter small permease [Brachybacterium sp. GCM10030267]|uniref:TRAP transporter small permease n=1 Tax=unclassified Brachybacterium TaxID=2623841 RepID=UPI00360E72B3